MTATFKTTESVVDHLNNEETRKKTGFGKVLEAKSVSGGYCNFVFRLFFEDETTAIFKYYPPFVTSDTTVSIWQKRFFAEKRALEILGAEKSLVESDCLVKTPRLLYSDEELYFLVMQDCGQNLVTLFEFLKQDYRPPASVLSEDTDEAREAFIRQTIDLLAKNLRQFLRTIATETSIKPQTHGDSFSNEYAWNALNSYYFAPDAAYAKKLGLEKELEYYIQNQRRFAQPPVEQSCFVHGDMWPNGIMLNVEDRIIWALDWEVARFETPFRDLEQLNANLWIMKQNERLFNASRIEYLIGRLQYEYFGDEKADLRVKSGEYAKINFVLWIIWLMRMAHWEIEDTRGTILKAITEVERL